jgi:hypothetical protein
VNPEPVGDLVLGSGPAPSSVASTERCGSRSPLSATACCDDRWATHPSFASTYVGAASSEGARKEVDEVAPASCIPKI